MIILGHLCIINFKLIPIFMFSMKKYIFYNERTHIWFSDTSIISDKPSTACDYVASVFSLNEIYIFASSKQVTIKRSVLYAVHKAKYFMQITRVFKIIYA